METEPRAPAPTADPAPVEPPADPAPVDPPKDAAPAPVPAPKEDWKTQQLLSRVAKLTAQKKDLEKALAAKQTGGAAPAPADEAAIQRLIDEKAEALAETKAEAKAAAKAAQSEFDRNCIAAVERGRTAFGNDEFNARMSSLRQLIDDGDVETQRQYTNFIAAMIETGEPSKLIYELGNDLNEASRLMKLNPVKQGIELAKLAMREAEGISKAPKPISPVANKGRSHEAIDPKDPARADNLDIHAWMARRSEQVAEYNKRVGRRVL